MDDARMSYRRLLEVIVETPGPDYSGQSDSNDDPLSCSDSDNDEGNDQEGEFNENDTGSFPPKQGPRWFTRKLDNQLYQRGFLSILRNAARAVLVDIMRNYARNFRIQDIRATIPVSLFPAVYYAHIASPRGAHHSKLARRVVNHH